MELLRKPFEYLGERIERHPFFFLGLAVVLLFVAVGGASQINSVTGDRAFISENPTYDQYTENFDRGAIAVLVRGEVDDPKTMEAIDRFDSRMSEVENVETVVSPADRVRAEYGGIPESSEKINSVVGNPRYTVVQVILKPDLTQKDEKPVYEKSVEAKDWAEFPAGVSVTITGNPAFSAQLSDTIQSSTQSQLRLAVGLMIVALFFFFRGVRLRLLPIVAVFVGVIYTFGAMGYLGIPNSTLTSAVFPILIGLGIDYSVQFHQRYEEELDRNPPSVALPRALKGIGPAVLVAMLAAGLGFAATWITSIGTPALVWFSQTSIIGIILSYISGIILLLSVLTIYAHWKERRSDVDEDDREGTYTKEKPRQEVMTATLFGSIIGKGSRKLAQRPGAIILVAGLLMVGGLYVSEDLGTLTDSEEFIPQDLPAYVNLQNFRSVTGGGSSVQYSVLVSGSDLRNPETLEWMEEFETVATGKPLITGVDSPADLVKQNNGGEIPATQAGVDEVISRLPESQTARYYSDGYAHITVNAERGMDTDEVLSFIDNVERAIETSQPPPGVEADLTGSSVLSPQNTVSGIESRNTTTALGAFLVFMLLLVYYRSPVKSVAPVVPMLFVVGWQGLYMYLLGIKVSPLSASLGALTIGIGAEYTVIVMERYFEEKRSGASKLDAVETATSRVGEAITVSGLTTIFGFSALVASPFPILSDFGTVTVGILGMTLVAALVTLPPTLVLLDGIGEKVNENL